ncbi:MAG TPA: hypothetical protein VGB03_05995, partial [Acidimicrobiales bacterium]
MADEHPTVRELRTFDYPKRAALTEEVDMVMKGGITSGVVYPLAVCELAKTKRFRNVGGSSAGGIAAGLAAAAELGRDNGGFGRLASLPSELGTDLLRIFQPSARTKPLFRVLLASIAKRPPVLKYAVVAWRIVLAAWVSFLIAAAVVLGLGLLALRTGGSEADGGGLAFALGLLGIPAIALGLLAAVVVTVVRGQGRLESNGYGLCRGSTGPKWSPAPPTGT